MSSKELAYSPCIIYCHGNAGNKIDIIEIFEFLLWDFNICSFDFSGAGHSEGDFVTLGFSEKYDIKAVVDFLRNELNIQKIILYGRSMGAVSSLRYAEMDANIKAIVLDSPFSSFPVLCKEILSNKFYIPDIISSALLSMTRDRILERIENFDINNFVPYKNAKNVQVPTIIIHGLQDSLVNAEHSRIIYNNLHRNTYKKLLEVEGEHNDCRSQSDVNNIRDFIMQFAYDSLVIKEHKRRLNIKNAHLNYTTKYGININSVISNFRNSIKKSTIKEKQCDDSSSLKNFSCQNSKEMEYSDKIINDAISPQSKNSEKRRMNNFNIHGNMKKNKILIPSHNKNFENLDRNDKYQLQADEYSDLIVNQELISENFITIEKIRSKSTDTYDDEVLSSKHKKESMSNLNLKAKYFKRESSNNTGFNSRGNGDRDFYSSNKEGEVYKKESGFNIKMIKYHEFGNNFKYSNHERPKEDIKTLNIDANNSQDEKNKTSPIKESPERKVSHNKQSISLSTNSGTNNLNATSVNISPLSNALLNESQLQFDNVNRNNITFHAFPVNQSINNKNKLRNERNNILGGILGCEVRVKSDQIKITNLDKSSLRKSSNIIDSVIDSTEIDVKFTENYEK